jgi:nucleoside-diphosphate-sugar epimerase
MKQKKLLITGASGFVGRNVVDEIFRLHKGYAIYNLSNKPLDIDGVENIIGDATNFDFSKLGKDFEYVINLLALSNDFYCQDLKLAEIINIDFTKHLLEFAETLPQLKKVIHMSSIIIYDNTEKPPVGENAKLYLNYSNYSFTKGISEYYARYFLEKRNLPLVIFRLSNIYGPYQDFKNSPFLVPSKIVQALTEKKIEVFNLKPKRDWIYSEDAATAVVKALESECTGVYNLASGVGISVEEIIKEIASQLTVPYSSLDKPTTGPLDFYCDVEKIKADLDWSPRTSLKDGVAKTIKYIKES